MNNIAHKNSIDKCDLIAKLVAICVPAVFACVIPFIAVAKGYNVSGNLLTGAYNINK